jgi:GAF domain-containing protein
MRRRSRTGGKPVKARLRGAATLKRPKGPKTVRRRSSSAARQEKEVARLTREREEALEQQTATSEILSVISRSNFKLQPVLQSVVNTAMRLCRAEQAVIYRQEQGTYRFAAGHSTVPDYLDIERGTVISPGEGTVVGRAALTKQVARIDDSWNDPLYEKKRDAKIGGVRSMIGVPLLREGETIGVIALARNRVEPFTDRETELVATFADQVVIAIENVRLFEAEQQRTRELSESLQQQTATSEVLQVISSSPGELQGVFDVILDKVVRICQADTATLFLYEKGTERRAARHSAVSHAVMPSVPSAKSGTMRSITTKQIIHIPDYLADPAYLEGDDFVVAAAERLGIRASLHVPMLREQEVAGAVTIWRREARAFTKSRLTSLLISPPRQSSPSRTRGCWPSCASRSSNRRLPQTCLRS